VLGVGADVFVLFNDGAGAGTVAFDGAGADAVAFEELFDPEATPPVPSSYPRPVSNWEGIPNNIDAALQYTNGKVYFFKDGQYYRWNDDSFSVDEANPSFPRDTGFWWFGCKQSSSPLVSLSK